MLNRCLLIHRLSGPFCLRFFVLGAIFWSVALNLPSLPYSLGQEGDWEHMKGITPQGYVCGMTNIAVKIDGILDEGSWGEAPWTADFVDIEGAKKPLPKFRTRAKMLWDNEFFYIGAELFEPHLQGTIVEHDAVIFQDNDFEVFIDPNSDNHEYFELELNALNTTWDLFMPRPYKDSSGADNGWEFVGLKTAVHLNGTLNDPSDQDNSWTVEIAIPWASFSTPSGKVARPISGEQWRVDFSRVEWQFEIVAGQYKKVPKTNENNWVWSPQGIVDMHRPERWGFVQFTQEKPGAVAFKPEGSVASRDLLMEIYHRQRSFHSKNGKWAKSLKELEFSACAGPESERFSLVGTEAGFEASVVVSSGDKSKELWHVRQDSKIWKSTENQLIQDSLIKAGDNRAELRRALDLTSIEQLEGMEFLIANMPERDLKTLTSEFLLEEVRLAYEAWNKSPWKNNVPKEIFLNNVLPYANINERRDSWRKDFSERFLPLVDGATTPTIAAARINQKLFPLVNVRYSTQRPKADQSPYESIKSSTASCTGLSVLLIDACRALGIPARFVGTPLWSDKSGNHSWVEIWDNGWHFTGAAEPSGDELDKAWFIGRASTAVRDDALNAIYAVSFQKTPIHFPLVWDRSIDYISAVNVTDRYTTLAKKPPLGTVETMFRICDRNSGLRLATPIRVLDTDGKVVFEGVSKDERFDANDHLNVFLPKGSEYYLELRDGKNTKKRKFTSEGRIAPITESVSPIVEDTVSVNNDSKAANVLAALSSYLSQPSDQRPVLFEQPFASASLTKAEAKEAKTLLWNDHADSIRKSRSAEMAAGVLTIDALKMPFTFTVFGEKPSNGRSMVISMHGGGGAPAKVNDQQWENQKKLYRLEEGIYVVPRAPTDTWDLWHQSHIDRFFDRLIENLIAIEGVDPNRVYIMGYSAGGDGVYQLAPRMADRFAAASMMAGHPNETSPLGLRNLPFTLHMGEKDSAYNRNKIASEWGTKLGDLNREDPDGYTHLVKIHEGKGHWMDRQDAEALPWMAQWTRNRHPQRIVWKQDDVVVDRFYWLAIDPANIQPRAEIIATKTDRHIDVQTKDTNSVIVRLCDEMMDLDSPISITSGSTPLFEGAIQRTIAVLAKTLGERGDPMGMFSAEVKVKLPNAGTR